MTWSRILFGGAGATDEDLQNFNGMFIIKVYFGDIHIRSVQGYARGDKIYGVVEDSYLEWNKPLLPVDGYVDYGFISRSKDELSRKELLGWLYRVVGNEHITVKVNKIV